MARVTGIGGVFFRSANPAKTAAWYQEHLGIEPEPDYPCASLRWTGGETTVWAPFEEATEYFGSPDQQFMVNYRVDDLDGLLDQLHGAGVQVLPEREDESNGRFAWAVDCDGRRIELWEPAEGH